MSMIHIGLDCTDSKLTNVQRGDQQPNAVDLRVAKVFRILSETFHLSETKKVHRGSVEMELMHIIDKDTGESEPYWYLEPGSYEVIMENQIDVAAGEAGFVITRSTLIRNGVFLTSGLYDSGYKGVMAAVMHVRCGSMRLGVGTRIGQYLSFTAQTASLYTGSYGHGTEDDKKYKS